MNAFGQLMPRRFCEPLEIAPRSRQLWIMALRELPIFREKEIRHLR